MMAVPDNSVFIENYDVYETMCLLEQLQALSVGKRVLVTMPEWEELLKLGLGYEVRRVTYEGLYNLYLASAALQFARTSVSSEADWGLELAREPVPDGVWNGFQTRCGERRVSVLK